MCAHTCIRRSRARQAEQTLREGERKEENNYVILLISAQVRMGYINHGDEWSVCLCVCLSMHLGVVCGCCVGVDHVMWRACWLSAWMVCAYINFRAGATPEAKSPEPEIQAVPTKAVKKPSTPASTLPPDAENQTQQGTKWKRSAPC